MFQNNGYYKTSNDYQKLFELLCEGQTIICIVDQYSAGMLTDNRTICKANRFDEFDINFSTPGVGYISINSYHKDKYSSEIECFIEKCNKMNVEFIVGQ